MQHLDLFENLDFNIINSISCSKQSGGFLINPLDGVATDGPPSGAIIPPGGFAKGMNYTAMGGAPPMGSPPMPSSDPMDDTMGGGMDMDNMGGGMDPMGAMGGKMGAMGKMGSKMGGGMDPMAMGMKGDML